MNGTRHVKRHVSHLSTIILNLGQNLDIKRFSKMFAIVMDNKFIVALKYFLKVP